MNNATKRPKISPEFKQEAVELVTKHGYSVAKAAQAVNTRENNLRRWIKNDEQQRSGQRLSNDERLELAKLRRENKELRMEKEILKKASAFFAKQMK